MLYTVVTGDDYDIKTNNNTCLRKIKYSLKQYKSILLEAMNYYSKRIVSDEIDLNDRYHDDVTYYNQINALNLVVKDDKFYGVVVSGLGRSDDYFIISTLDNMIVEDSKINGYNSIDCTYKILESNLPLVAKEFDYKYHITWHSESYKVIDGKEVLVLEYKNDCFLLADCVLLEDGVAVGVVFKEHEFRINNPETMQYKKMTTDFYGITYHNYTTYKLIEME
jgi:hypothetical protein